MKATGANFFSSMWDFFAKRFLISAGACLVLLLGSAGQMHAQTYPTLPSCGGEGERPCTEFDWEFIQNGSGECDRGLIGPDRISRPHLTTCVNHTRQLAPVDPWTDWSLRNQENLAIDEPLNWVSRLGNHNAYNAFQEGYIDGNQYWSMTDQLRLGARHFQLDLHWANGDVRLCHSGGQNVFCSDFDRLYAYGIKEIANWLDANPGEVMTIDFEDYVYKDKDCNPIENHDKYVNDPLATYLGSKILTPAEWPDYEKKLPTKREMLALGKQVIFISSSGCPDTHGGTWIFPSTKLGGAPVLFFPLPSGILLASGAPNVDFRPEDRHCYTGIHAPPSGPFDILNPGYFPQSTTPASSMFSWIAELRIFGPGKNTWIHEADVERAVHCRVSLEVLDDVTPIDGKPNDQRHQAAVWSWLQGEPWSNPGILPEHGHAALLMHDATRGFAQPWNRWVSINTGDVHPFMCARPRSESGGPPESWYASGEGYDWKVTSGSGTWFDGGQRCLAEFGPDYVFSVPVSGYQNVHASLQVANAGTGGAWINYNDIKSNGSWVINHRPIAVAGPDQTVECNAFGTGTVTVNGSLSHDPDGDSLTYAWTGALQSATGPVATIRAPMGVSTIRLVVDDGYSGVGSDDMRVTVRDTTPPVIRSAVANPNSSWPPNHKMFRVRLSVDASDICDPNPRCRVVSVTSNEGTRAPGSGLANEPDWEIVGPLEVMLRSERSGNGGARVYTIWIQCTDASGNASTRGVTVTIAHDQRKSNP
jgi:hypothetical protein